MTGRKNEEPLPTLSSPRSTLSERSAPYEPRGLLAVGARPPFCPDCSYALTGLPEAHACPECGFAYDDATVMLYAEASGFGPPIWMGWTFGLIPLLNPTINPITRAVGPTGFMLLLLFFLALLGWWIYGLLQRRRLGGTTLLVIQPRGVGIRRPVGKLRWYPWSEIRHIRVGRFHRWGLSWRTPLKPKHAVRISRTRPWGQDRAPTARSRFFLPVDFWLALVFEGNEQQSAALERAIAHIRKNTAQP